MKKIKIAYVGGGSRAWARVLMSDLAKEKEICGEVYLYDIDFESAKQNEIIGNGIKNVAGATDNFSYVAVKQLSEALTGADFVIISILPGTFDEMESDIHTPEKYGIYQSVGDTTGPGGIVRTLRTVPMIKQIALGVKEFCPSAWVINYTNPMSACVRTLYRTFPAIKAYGCCHEVFGTEKLLSEMAGNKGDWHDVKVNVLGINHFTWINQAVLGDTDLMPVYSKFVDENYEKGYKDKFSSGLKPQFACRNRVKFDLFRRYGIIAAAGDRHLAEFCPGKWYLKSPEQVNEWGFMLTDVRFRKEDLKERLLTTEKLLMGEEQFVIEETGEEGVKQIKALLGLGNFVTNVNLPNRGQLDGVPVGAVVETNVKFMKDDVKPMYAGSVPKNILPLIVRPLVGEELSVESALSGDYEKAFQAFCNDALVDLSLTSARKLFEEMLYNTKKYLPFYDDYVAGRKNNKRLLIDL